MIGWENMKNVRFPTENWPYLGNGERYDQRYYKSRANKKWRMPFQMK